MLTSDTSCATQRNNGPFCKHRNALDSIMPEMKHLGHVCRQADDRSTRPVYFRLKAQVKPRNTMEQCLICLAFIICPHQVAQQKSNRRGQYAMTTPASKVLADSPDFNTRTHSPHCCQISRSCIPSRPAVHPCQRKRESWQHDVVVYIDIGLFTCAGLFIDPDLHAIHSLHTSLLVHSEHCDL